MKIQWSSMPIIRLPERLLVFDVNILKVETQPEASKPNK